MDVQDSYQFGSIEVWLPTCTSIMLLKQAAELLPPSDIGHPNSLARIRRPCRGQTERDGNRRLGRSKGTRRSSANKRGEIIEDEVVTAAMASDAGLPGNCSGICSGTDASPLACRFQ